MKRLLLFLCLVLVFIVFSFSELKNIITLEHLKSAHTTFMSFHTSHPVLTPVLYCVAYILIVTLALPLTALATLLGGALFGLTTGTILTAFSATIGATLLFWMANTTLGEPLRRRINPKTPTTKNALKNLQKNSFFYLLSLRLVPVFPFPVINILPAFIGMKTYPYILATFLGILPGTAVYVNIGQNLADIKNLTDILSPAMLIAFGLLALLSLLPVLWRSLFKK